MYRWFSLAVILATAACSGTADKPQQASGPGQVDATLLVTGGDKGDWPAIGHSYKEQHFSPLTQINDSNVNQLGIAWFADLPDARGQEATPVVVDGVMYLSGAWSKVWAFDAATGKQLWAYDPEVPKETLVTACCDAVNRGVAVWKGKVYVGTLDGRLVALDAGTGKPVWSVQTTDRTKPYTITGAPRVVKDMVIIGNGGAEFGVRGYVTAYNAATGAKKWRFYTIPNPNDTADGEPSDKPLKTIARPTWSDKGQWKESGGGGTVWDAIVYDPELDLLYLGVGNGSPWNYQLRSEGKGDNLFLGSVVAIRPETGEYVWHYQETRGDNWDFTSTQPIVLADLTIDGKARKVLLHAPKNGYFYVIDRATGKPISADPYVKGITWAQGYDAEGRPKATPASQYGTNHKFFLGVPGAMGAHSWQPMAFSPKTGLVYIPANIAGLPYAPPADADDTKRKARGFNVGLSWAGGVLPRDPAAIKATIAATKGALIAWDPVARKEKWRISYTTPWNSGTLATAGNLVFQGSATAEFQAFAADSGKKLFSLPVQSGVLAAPSTYSVKGEQYVAFTTSHGGVFALAPGKVGGAYNRIPNIPRVIVLKLGGKAQLPPPPPQEDIPLNPPPSTGSKAQIETGLGLYARYCSVCHGDSATSGGTNPDLRHSGALADADTWKSIVIDGVLKDNGMVSFSPVLTPEQANEIRLYVIDQANWDKAHPVASPKPVQ
ncbi:MAG TPA: PQQ-dependent dehydrogenase, methanol/ethanol family [Sphingomonadaceae bacterium]|nr:PQQ-dependent dehydrogenase, methanol/ethanol family [Sphingomonadaceae bacterium]